MNGKWVWMCISVYVGTVVGVCCVTCPKLMISTFHPASFPTPWVLSTKLLWIEGKFHTLYTASGKYLSWLTDWLISFSLKRPILSESSRNIQVSEGRKRETSAPSIERGKSSFSTSSPCLLFIDLKNVYQKLMHQSPTASLPHQVLRGQKVKETKRRKKWNLFIVDQERKIQLFPIFKLFFL